MGGGFILITLLSIIVAPFVALGPMSLTPVALSIGFSDILGEGHFASEHVSISGILQFISRFHLKSTTMCT